VEFAVPGAGERVIDPDHRLVEVLSIRLGEKHGAIASSLWKELRHIEGGRVEAVHRDLVIGERLAVGRVFNHNYLGGGVIRIAGAKKR
jgi:hypothetical protein